MASKRSDYTNTNLGNLHKQILYKKTQKIWYKCLDCLKTLAHACKQFAQTRYMKWNGQKSNQRELVHKSNVLIITSPCHTLLLNWNMPTIHPLEKATVSNIWTARQLHWFRIWANMHDRNCEKSLQHFHATYPSSPQHFPESFLLPSTASLLLSPSVLHTTNLSISLKYNYTCNSHINSRMRF